MLFTLILLCSILNENVDGIKILRRIAFMAAKQHLAADYVYYEGYCRN